MRIVLEKEHPRKTYMFPIVEFHTFLKQTMNQGFPSFGRNYFLQWIKLTNKEGINEQMIFDFQHYFATLN